MPEQIRIAGDDTLVESRPMYEVDGSGGDTAGRAPVDDDPDAARAKIEMTRQRLSGTIDEIEGVILRKKEQIQDRLDVMAPIRERPLPSIGVALGAGLVLGFLTGGDDDDDDRPGGHAHSHSHAHSVDDAARAEMWEDRARRLLKIAQEQEAELGRLSGAPSRVSSETWDERHGHSAIHDFRDKMVGGLSDYLSAAVRDLTSKR